jgi:hypothetical protein
VCCKDKPDAPGCLYRIAGASSRRRGGEDAVCGVADAAQPQPGGDRVRSATRSFGLRRRIGAFDDLDQKPLIRMQV